MRIIAINHIDETDRRNRLPSDWDIWTTTSKIGLTYRMVSEQALREGWGLETVLVQDDVRGDFQPVDEFTVYGTEISPNHICPKAFAADYEAWELLWREWHRKPKSVCLGFTKVVRDLGAVVLNTVSEVH